ncbi:hypothetical protein [Stenotrophomonas maltophilia]|uniref:hypothetical protein n=1 Tax=Stenotrophomonas maltophilia TaxID=40324 RepID=UPI0012DB7875|nr:hypothetical protein [Stenotrophomonas maltophilia]
MKFSHTSYLAPILGIGALMTPWIVVATPHSSVADSPQNVVHMKATDRAQVESDLTKEAQKIVDELPPLPGQASNSHRVSVKFNKTGELLIVDLGRDFVPEMYGAQFEDNLHEISRSLLPLLEGVIPVKGVEFQYSGKSIYDYFPEERHETPIQVSPTARSPSILQSSDAAQ